MNGVRMMLLVLALLSVGSLVGCKSAEEARPEPNEAAPLQSQDHPGQESPAARETAMRSEDQQQGDSSPPPTGVALAGTLHFAGRPIHELTSVEPTFSFNNVDTGERGIRPEARYDRGRFEIRELPPGDYVMFVAINANADNPGGFPGYPGDFLLRAKAGRVSIPEGGTTFDVGLAQVIHLTLPQDNGSVMERWGKKGPDMIAFESPVEFAWHAVTDGAQYHCAIHRMQSEPFKTIERDVEKSTTDATRVALALAPNEPNQFYLFQLHATKGQHRIGELVTHGERGYGNDLRFRELKGSGPFFGEGNGFLLFAWACGMYN